MLKILQVILHLERRLSTQAMLIRSKIPLQHPLTPLFSPTSTRTAPTPFPGISGSLYRGGDALRMLVLMLSFTESAPFGFLSPLYHSVYREIVYGCGSCICHFGKCAQQALGILLTRWEWGSFMSLPRGVRILRCRGGSRGGRCKTFQVHCRLVAFFQRTWILYQVS